MSLRGKIEIAELTDTGRVREHNEDAIGSNPDIGLLVLADGMVATTPVKSPAVLPCRS
jgi:serine/threonine protein phosphatase PrpC